MNMQMEAVYENGVFRPLQPVALVEHQRVIVTLDDGAGSATPIDAAHFALPPDQWQAFCDALDAPPRNVPALQKLLARVSLFDDNGSPAL
jgi:Protein of unknown function DUF104/Protein of unknown function (DUF1778)